MVEATAGAGDDIGSGRLGADTREESHRMHTIFLPRMNKKYATVVFRSDYWDRYRIRYL